jgi:hypothetical protein
MEGSEIMMRYFEVHFDSVVGTGAAYQEFDGDAPVRQVERYGEQWYASRLEPAGSGHDARPLLAELGLGSEHEIAAAEFDWVWALATRGERGTARAA